MTFADMHIHALFGVDDGAGTPEDMKAIVRAEYEDGIRYLCLTPHCHPGYFGDNKAKIASSYAQLKEWVETEYPDLTIGLGNELRYARTSTDWLRDGYCHTMNGSRYVLVDFSEVAPEKTITGGLMDLLNHGYSPILAHAERYTELHGNLNLMAAYKRDGVLLQADARAIFRDYGRKTEKQCKKMLEYRLFDLVSSDAHDMKDRPPGLSEAYEWICSKCGKDYAAAVCRDNAIKMIFSPTERDKNHE